MDEHMLYSCSDATRRGFLRTVAGSAVGLGVAGSGLWSMPARAFGANERVRVGFIGVRNQGTNNLRRILGRSDADVAAVCDVDQAVLAKAGRLVEERAGRACPAFSDYRELLDRRDIDAVLISTPDHWHALPTVDACRAGKDVYCEKPLTLTIEEGRVMVRVARETDRVIQTGSQQRSSGRFRRACEIVRRGGLGRIDRIVVGLPGVNFDGPPVSDTEPPEELDYDFWLGPAPERPYNPKQVHYNFRFFWPYSGGQMTNWGAHHLDIVQWALDRDGSGPVEIEPKNVTYHSENWYEVPSSSEVVFRYEGGPTVVCRQGLGEPNGVRFEGKDGTLFVSRSALRTDPPALLEETPEDPVGVGLSVRNDHHGDWLDRVRDRKRPICDVAIGHRSATVCHLGNIAARLGRTIRWDPASEQIRGDAEAAAMVSRPYRSPWALEG